ncbi:MAG: hypothetical protein NDI69_02005 [Bacteriovoracaceae bacterium]|nr:hypothetical protein [Bacteriovoracaceae bacterium]
MKLISCFLILISLPSTYASALNFDERWEMNSDPEIMSYFFTREFDQLPLKGTVSDKNKYWSGDYWALNKGNINYRWNARRKVGFNLNSPSKQKAMAMSIPQLAELSPSEKYDLFTGRYDYPLREEVSRIAADRSAEIWEGICHGWAPATMNHKEPTPKLMVNPDGIEIPFGSSDIKALLSYYYAYGFEVPDTFQMGRRCFSNSSWFNRDKNCQQDMNAGAFHIVLANRLGIDGKGFIADLNRYKQVWNHPISSYQSVITGTQGPLRRSAPGTVKVINLKTTITYVDERGHDWRPVIGTAKQYFKQMTYYYGLDIDRSGTIIGGEWTSSARPDFLWLKHKPRKFEGVLHRLQELVD